MYKATQHVPSFIDTSEPSKTVEFSSVEELLQTDWIQNYLKWKEADIFVKTPEGDCLLVSNHNHSWWWVVAYVPKGSVDSLPVCRYNKSEA